MSGMILSSLLTFSLGLQVLAFAQLQALVEKQKGLQGISMKMVTMYCRVSACRLFSTVFKDGYLPEDSTGDCIYQLCDFLSLIICFGMLASSKGRYLRTYNEEADSFDLGPVTIVCFIMAFLVHGDLNDSPLFDIVWMLSLNLDTVAMLPQLWSMAKVGGKVHALMGHFIACIFLSRVCSLVFWAMAYPELAPLDAPEGSLNIAGIFIVLPQLAQAIGAGDFMFTYVKSHMNSEDLVIPAMDV